MKKRYELYNGVSTTPIFVEEVEMTDEEITAEAVKARRDEYSKIDGEGMDAIRKAIEQLAGFLVTDLPPEYKAYAAKVAEIKGKHPKLIKKP